MFKWLQSILTGVGEGSPVRQVEVSRREEGCRGDVNSIACQIEYGDELDAWSHRDISPIDDREERFKPWG